ncbi:MAG: hypothetical protein ACMG6E_03320, partial [Candidatus Roizmanbacteria bacterium]
MAERSIIDPRSLQESLFPGGRRGVVDENDRLQSALFWGPVSVETYLARLFPKDVSLFLDDMDVLKARDEFHGFHDALTAQGVTVAIGRDILADIVGTPSIDNIETLTRLLVAKANLIERQNARFSGLDHNEIIRVLLDRDVKRYGEEAAIALNEQLALLSGLPLGNIMYACDQMKLADNPQINQVARRYEADDAGEPLDVVGSRYEIIVDTPICEQINEPQANPPRSLLIDRQRMPIVIRSTISAKVDDRKEKEADVRKKEEVRNPHPNRGPF